MVFLQRYYWFKKEDPVFTNADNADLFPILIDHTYKECLTTIRPKIKFYKNYEEANKAVDKIKRQLYPNIDENQEEKLDTITEIPESGREGENTEELSSEGNSDDEDLKPREMMEEEDEPEADEISEQENRRPTRKDEKTQEDLEFEQMFEKLAQESYQERLREAAKVTAGKDIPVPTTGKQPIKKTYEQLQTVEPEAPTDSVPFTLMLRGPKAGKQQLKVFQAPIESPLAQNLIKQKEQLREENERVKRLTLNITERIEEEDYQESLLQRPVQIPQFRNQKYQKFKHQKGVPDADKIFN